MNGPIYATAKGGVDFEKIDVEKEHQIVLSHIFGPFQQMSEYKGKKKMQTKVILMFEIDQRFTEGEYLGKRMLHSVWFTLSIGEKANMRGFLVSWRGRDFNQEELEQFDITKLVGVNAFAQFLLKTKPDGGKKIAISSIRRVPMVKTDEGIVQPSVPLLIPELPRDYCPDWVKLAMGTPTDEHGAPSPDNFEDDIPFAHNPRRLYIGHDESRRGFLSMYRRGGRWTA